MRGYPEDEKASHLLFIGVWIVYAVICLTKNTYSAAIAGIANAFGSFGVMLANFGYGFIAEYLDWNAVIVTWIILAAVSLLLTALSIPLWRRFTRKA